MKKILGILGLFVVVCLATTLLNPQFVSAGNVENLIRWTALFGIISIGASFVIVTSGIDLSIGSVIGLCGCLLPMFLTVTYTEPEGAYVVKQVDKPSKSIVFEGELPSLRKGDRLAYKSASGTDRQLKIERVVRREAADESEVVVQEEPTYLDAKTPMSVARQEHMSIPLAVLLVLLVSAAIGVAHGLLITKLKLQPFVVTLCGLMIYRSLARFLARDQMQGFGTNFDELKYLVLGRPFSIPLPFINWISEGNWGRYRWDFENHARVFTYYNDPFTGELTDGTPIPLDIIQWVAVPMPVLILLVIAVAAGVFMNYSVYGRYLLALGRNEQAARYSGINTDRMIILAYVLCALLSGLAGMLFALDVNAVQPTGLGQTYELYAIAAAVLGGCSLRGGENSVIGIIIGAAVMRALYNSINLVGVHPALEFAIIGGVILAGAVVDELFKRIAAKRRALHEAAAAEKAG